jgi:hypothetical protein
MAACHKYKCRINLATKTQNDVCQSAKHEINAFMNVMAANDNVAASLSMAANLGLLFSNWSSVDIFFLAVIFPNIRYKLQSFLVFLEQVFESCRL